MSSFAASLTNSIQARGISEVSLRDVTATLQVLRLWQVDLDEPELQGGRCQLSATELQRSGRFVYARDARRFVAAHVALRTLLSQQWGVRPREEFVVDANGKPRLGAGRREGFNISHSGSTALVCLGPGPGVGVDVEELQPMPDASALAQANFDSSEIEDLSLQSPESASIAFLTVWTRKEACLKAWGVGLNLSPLAATVGLARQAREVTLESNGQRVRVCVQSIDIGVGKLAAMALATDDSPVHSDHHARL